MTGTIRRTSHPGNVHMEEEAYGTGGLTLALVHGAMSSRRTFDPLREALLSRSGDALTVLAFDLPGFGASSKAAEEYGYAEQAARLARALRGRGGPTVVVGHSMGGAIALHLALDHRDLVDGLVILDTGLGQARGGGSINAASGAGPVRLTRELMLRYVAGWLCEARPELVAGLADDALRMSEASFQGVRRAVAAHDLSARVAELPDVPVLVIRGRDDRTRTHEEVAEVAAVFRRSVLLEVPDAGHCPHVERPDAVASAVVGWLAGAGFVSPPRDCAWAGRC